MKPAFSSGKAGADGYILFEVLIAVGIFAIAAVALASALSETISSATRLQRETAITWNLESRLNETRIKRLDLGKKTLDPDSYGTEYEEEVRPIDLKNIKNQTLNGLYNITITARWKENDQAEERSAQIYVYQP